MISCAFGGGDCFSSFVENDPLMSNVSALFITLPRLKSVVSRLPTLIVEPHNVNSGVAAILEINSSKLLDLKSRPLGRLNVLVLGVDFEQLLNSRRGGGLTQLCELSLTRVALHGDCAAALGGEQQGDYWCDLHSQ